MYHQVIYLPSGQAIDCGHRPAVMVHAERQAPPSLAWFCARCGDIWARCVVADQPFMIILHPCEAHTDPCVGWLVPGSLIDPWDRDFNDSLPEILWKREFELHLKHYERS